MGSCPLHYDWGWYEWTLKSLWSSTYKLSRRYNDVARTTRAGFMKGVKGMDVLVELYWHRQKDGIKNYVTYVYGCYARSRWAGENGKMAPSTRWS